MILRHNMNAQRLSFSIYLGNGQKKPGLRKSFILQRELNMDQTTITIEDGSVWPIYFERSTKEDNSAGQWPKRFIISFQVYEDGDYFAVARLHTQRKMK